MKPGYFQAITGITLLRSPPRGSHGLKRRTADPSQDPSTA